MPRPTTQPILKLVRKQNFYFKMKTENDIVFSPQNGEQQVCISCQKDINGYRFYRTFLDNFFPYSKENNRP